jgi:pectin methylesterase-like acyl-CoA thioesterase
MVRMVRGLCITVSILVISFSILAFEVQANRIQSAEIIVPDQYPTIQAAVNSANDGDTIFVKAGTYYEHLVVNRTVSPLARTAVRQLLMAMAQGTSFM